MHSYEESMIELFNEKLPLCVTNTCISTHSEVEITVYDSPTSWCIINQPIYHSKILNPHKKEFQVIALDKCCLDHTFEGKRCDFGILVENEQLILIEIKEAQYPKYRNPRSIKQLENTIQFFIKEGLTSIFPKLTAIVNWGHVPRQSIVNCSSKTARLRFRTNYGFELYEGNDITV